MRSLEQELLHALVNCLTADDIDGNLETLRHHAEIMIRFEEALAAQAGQHLNVSALCTEIGVPERTLRMCCAEFLGMSPSRYFLLRRLESRAFGVAACRSGTCKRRRDRPKLQFLEPGRFAVTYRTVFGEMPSATLRRAPIKTT